ncbi:CIA30 family protein [Longibacter sp.]|jgi:monofunctional biosynthetic peptidoglycan transglycosylase|uniref:CIA30 family protein n=1 Tax=Longibacter sp. TaxID=2045415 RepID=UPI003EBB6511
MTHEETSDVILFDAEARLNNLDADRPAQDISAWRIVNDTVMGGVSTSSVSRLDTAAKFSGEVSLEHGGGFASVRAPEQRIDVSAADGFHVTVRGDGKTYKWTAYTHTGGAISYRVPFTPAADWQTIFLPFANLKPFRRGRHLPSAPAFDPASLRTFGILIGDKQAGPFRLDIRRVTAGGARRNESGYDSRT